jgi:hypothetical protein
MRDPTAKPRIETALGPRCPWPRPESRRFVDEWPAGVPHDEDLCEAYERALVELLRSDIPLDPDTRDLLADVVEEFYFPKMVKKQERQEKQRAEDFRLLQVVDGMKNFLRHNKKKPLSALDAEAVLAERMFHIEVEALRKRIHRARQLLRKR